MQEDYEGDVEAEEAEEAEARAALEAKQAAENAVGAQLAAANPPAAEAVAGAAGNYITEIDGLFTVRKYTGGSQYVEVYQAGKCYLVGYVGNADCEVVYDEKTKTMIGKLNSDTGLLSFDDAHEPATVSLSATQAAKPGEINIAVKIHQAVEKIKILIGVIISSYAECVEGFLTYLGHRCQIEYKMPRV
jgi:hypothetical protein